MQHRLNFGGDLCLLKNNVHRPHLIILVSYRLRLQHRHDDQEFLCANVLQSFLPVKYTWRADAADKFQPDGGTTAGGVVSDHSAGCQDIWPAHPQVLQSYSAP